MAWFGPSRLIAGAAACAWIVAAQPPAPGVQTPATPSSAPATVQSTEPEPLKPTVHAALPQNIDDYWFAPRPSERAAPKDNALAQAAAAYASANYAAARTYAGQAAATGGPLEPYAQLYLALSLVRDGSGPEAEKIFGTILDGKPQGYLSVAALQGKADAMELRGDHAGAADIYDRLAVNKGMPADEMLARVARAAAAAGDRKRAAEAWLRVYYEFPLSESAKNAAEALPSFADIITKRDDKLDLGRALVLFGARRYTEARSALQSLQDGLGADDREVVALRIAECDYFLKRYAAARDGVSPFLETASRRAEAKFFYLTALRALGEVDESIRLTHALVDEFPDSSWAAEALNNLGTQYILSDDDELAAGTFKEAYEKFPNGPYAERSAWKYGWYAYTTGTYPETIRVFESAAASFPRSDYRPPFLYWAARAREKLGQHESAQARLRLVYTDYLNSYYGRLARKRLPAVPAEPPAQPVATAYQTPAPAAALLSTPPPTAGTIRRLLAAGLYDAALDELRFAQKTWGTSPAIEATIAWVYHERGELRRAITAMRRAYPQFLAQSGEDLPAEILQVIFPLTYWDAIKKNAALYELDPYLIAALILQESTFDPTAHSAANAWGLMQLVPATGRRLAVALGIRRFNTAMLTNGDTNIRLGTLYFKRLVAQFGGAYYALASYNAGENRVVRWKAERPGMEEEVFIDDIPFPETQNYVKRVLGIAEDYRRLYGEGEGRPIARPAVKKPAPSAKSSKSKASKKKSAASSKKKKTTPAKKKAPPKKKTPPKKRGGG